jgi:hypothetical protein
MLALSVDQVKARRLPAADMAETFVSKDSGVTEEISLDMAESPSESLTIGSLSLAP